MAEVSPVVLRPPEAVRRPFRVSRAPVDGPLGAVVENLWSVEWALPPGASYEQEVLTHPCAHLTVEDGEVWVQGVVTRVFRRRLVGAGRVVGAKLRPAGLSALTEVPPASVADRRLPARELLADPDGDGGPGGVRELVEAVDGAADREAGMAAMAAWLAARAPRRPAGAELVDRAVELATAEPELARVDELAARLGVSLRTLQRRFDRHLGVGPKWVLQRCRIQDALAGIEAGTDPDWAELAVRLGFADQSHFVNTFTAMVGLPPGQYRRRAPLDRP
ncbi:MAG TPA: helix-turn-helix domain-containing protein [Mycobacteriales bacterium]